MKKLLLLTLILCLVLPCFGCDTPDAPPTGDDSTDETTTEETTEETTTVEETRELPKVGPDSFLINEEDYRYYFEQVPPPEEFVTLDELSEFGTFDQIFLGDAVLSAKKYNFRSYIYFFHHADPPYEPYELVIRHDDYYRYISDPTLRKRVELPIPTTENIMLYKGYEKQEGSFWVDEIQYTYEKGRLTYISWMIEDIEFTIYFPYSPGIPFDWEDPQTPILRDLFNLEMAPTAIARFAAKLRGEEETP